MLVLGIETSCDETALAVVEDGRRVVSSSVASSLPSHQRYGGVVPEIASRAHVELITYELEQALQKAGLRAADIDRVAVTRGPGLSGCLVTGVAGAKALALVSGRPLVGVNHLHAHLYAALMDQPQWSLDARMVGLVISGGHTALVQMNGIRSFKLLGQTRDDAVGEAFDKVAQILGLGFPGGPEIERAAKEGNPKAHRFSTPKIKSGTPFDFSLSGIKTAVLHKVRGPLQKEQAGNGKEISREFVQDMAASFQASIVEEVVMKSVEACRVSRVSHLAVGGGVVANGLLRSRLQEVCADFGIEVALPPVALCTDNGAMVAGLGFHLQPVLSRELGATPDLSVEMN